ncbi:MAG TPA: condensation domain-containing protein, partial [Acidobacteriaceae bacterium]|nr:condensation domain-containing protein [Acidobacteriaceae bacterium]
MLFHSLYEKDGVDPYVIQLALTLDGPLSPELLRASAEALVGRHDILRVSFHPRSSGQAVQIVHETIAVPWAELDLSGFCVAERQERLGRYRAKDRATRFDMARSPLLRFCLVKFAAEQHVLLMTYHHILLDAWSFQLVIQELFLLYARKADPSELGEAVTFRRYLAWLINRDRQAAGDAWRKSLAGLPGPTLVAGAAKAGYPASFPKLSVTKLSEELTAALTEAARTAGLTLNTMIHGAWALLLCRVTGQQDVIFGQTVSGRAPDIDGIEEIVGPLINAAPVRVRLDPHESCAALLARIQQEQLDVIPYHHLGLADIQRATGMNDLYDTSTAFVNGSLDSSSIPGPAAGLSVRISAAEERGQEGTGTTHYPLSLT